MTRFIPFAFKAVGELTVVRLISERQAKKSNVNNYEPSRLSARLLEKDGGVL